MESSKQAKQALSERKAERFLRACLQGSPAVWPSDAGQEFGKELLSLCRRHGVTALLHHVLDGRTRELGWPDEVSRSLSREAGLSLLRQEILDRELRVLVEELGRREFASLVLKGAAVSRLAYPHPHLRPRVDSDLWVREEDLPEVRQCLPDLGYRLALSSGGEVIQYQQSWKRPVPAGEHVVDLHWRISNVQVFSRCFDFEEEWAGRIPLTTLSQAAHTLSEKSSLLLACLHRVAHHGGDDRLIWLADISRLLAALDPDEQESFLESARSRELDTICHSSINQALAAFPLTNLAGSLSRWLKAPPLRNEAGLQFLDHANDRVAILASDFRELPGWRLKLRFAREHLLPPVQYMRQRYGASAATLPWYYLKRAVGGAFRTVFTARRKVTVHDTADRE